MIKLVPSLVLCTFLATAPALAADSGDGWVTLGGGWYNGEDYEPDPAASRDSSGADGAALHLSVNRAGPVLFRVRGSWLLDYTSNTAEEVAGLIGVPLNPERNFFVAAGVSRLTDVSAAQQSPTVGVPVELIWYPVRGLELMLHGNFNDDSNFIGVAIGGAIGRQRARN